MKVAELLQHEKGGAYGQVSSIGMPSRPVVDAVMVRRNNIETGQRKEVGSQGVSVREQVKEPVEARESGVAYMMGHTYIYSGKQVIIYFKVVCN